MAKLSKTRRKYFSGVKLRGEKEKMNIIKKWIIDIEKDLDNWLEGIDNECLQEPKLKKFRKDKIILKEEQKEETKGEQK